MTCNIFAVPRRVLNELLADKLWSRRLDEANTFQDALRVVKAFCHERGYEIHHKMPSGELTICR